jgi:hypothetical protein
MVSVSREADRTSLPAIALKVAEDLSSTIANEAGMQAHTPVDEQRCPDHIVGVIAG